MPFGWDDAIGIGGSILAGGLNLAAQGQQQSNQQSALQMAMQDYLLRRQAMERQYELATAGQTDARGNQTRYVPGRGWVTDLTPQSQSMINRSDAVQNQGYVESLGRGAEERRGAFNRRITEGSAASPLLDALRFGYGAPSREGVSGASKIADVTAASEGADQARSGYASAALRTGSGAVPLQSTIASLDRGATSGIRTALARGDSDAGPLYTQMLDQFRQSNLNPYNTLASRASNVENMPFAPENISGGLDTMSGARARSAPDALAKAAYGFAGASSPIINTMLMQRQPNYDTFIGGLTENLKPFFRRNNNGVGSYSGSGLGMGLQ